MCNVSCVVRPVFVRAPPRIQQVVFLTSHKVKSVYLFNLLFSFHSSALGKGSSGSSGIGRISGVGSGGKRYRKDNLGG